MTLTVSQNANFLQVGLGIVSPGMLSCWRLGTDDQHSIGNFIVRNLQNLLEIMDEGIDFMEAILDPLQKLLEYSPFLDADIVWNYHVVESARALHRRVMDIQLCKDWVLTI